MKTIFKILIGFTLLALIVIFCAAIFEPFITTKVLEINVIKLERILDDNNRMQYYIHTPNEVFRNMNNYYHNKSNEDALMKLFEKNKNYKVKVIGYGLSFDIPYSISKHRNIINIVK